VKINISCQTNLQVK